MPRYFEARFGPAPPWVKFPPARPRSLSRSLSEARGCALSARSTGSRRRGGGAARVIDYKTGGVYGEKDNRFRGAQRLQLPLYLLAADTMLEHHGVPASAQEALYYYATGKGRYRWVRFDRAALDARFPEFTAILRTIADGIAGASSAPRQRRGQPQVLRLSAGLRPRPCHTGRSKGPGPVGPDHPVAVAPPFLEMVHHASRPIVEIGEGPCRRRGGR
jgi:hypothetical protein